MSPRLQAISYLVTCRSAVVADLLGLMASRLSCCIRAEEITETMQAANVLTHAISYVQRNALGEGREA